MHPGGRQDSERGLLEALIERSSLTTLLCRDQRSKLLFLSRLIASNSERGGLTIYIDLDTAFTAFLERGGDVEGKEDIVVFRPRGGEIDEAVAAVCSLNLPIPPLIIFDSTTTFYTLQSPGGDTSSLNMKLSLYLTLLEKAAVKAGGRLIFTSMSRARRGDARGGGLWHHSFSGGRLLRLRSDLIVELSMEGRYVEASIVKCHDVLFQGRRLILEGLDPEYEEAQH